MQSRSNASKCPGPPVTEAYEGAASRQITLIADDRVYLHSDPHGSSGLRRLLEKWLDEDP